MVAEIEQGVILIGNKPTMVYATTALMQLQALNFVRLKARGRAISRAVDVAEVLKRKFGQFKVKEIITGSEEKKQENKVIFVSTIEIVLEK
jgi:DNA-binding protein